MKTLLAILALTLSVATAQTQGEMNAGAGADFEKSDRELNAVYKQVHTGLNDESREKLKAAQRAWIAFRDAEAEFRADRVARGGSIYSMILFEEKKRLTDIRIKELKELLVPYEDR